jgi:hypothetical protein
MMPGPGRGGFWRSVLPIGHTLRGETSSMPRPPHNRGQAVTPRIRKGWGRQPDLTQQAVQPVGRPDSSFRLDSSRCRKVELDARKFGLQLIAKRFRKRILVETRAQAYLRPEGCEELRVEETGRIGAILKSGAQPLLLNRLEALDKRGAAAQRWPGVVPTTSTHVA